MTPSDDALVGLDHDIDLVACEQEPIHTPGAIQPQGVLLVAQLDDFIVTHASDNLDHYLGVPPDAALGRPLREVLGEAACDAVRGTLACERYAPCVVLAVTAPKAPFPLQMVVHTTGGSVYVELEVAPQSGNQGLVLQRTQAIMHALHAARSQRELCDIVVMKLRELTGYDRVMVYRFDREGNGEVIAEDRDRDLEPYLGLHYPGSDIPPQARRMYLAQRVRAIADVDYVPVPMRANPALGQVPPVDMTLCALRSVSPAHLEYMRNMGTRASLGVSLIPSSSLWGLLVCHHRSPLVITADLRAQCDLLGQLMSLLLGTVGEAECYAEQLRRQRTLHEVIARVTALGDVADALLASGDAILSMLDASGAMIRLGERTVTLGSTPPIETATRAMTALITGSDADLIATDELRECVPDWETESATASGALYLALPPGLGDAIMWFRPEIEREVKWAGDPTKAVDPDPTTGRLSPRRSFAVWSERIAGHSEPWQEADRATARELRRTITTALARQAVAELAKLRHYDSLTQLPNRRMLQEHLDALGAVSDVALLFLDLDGFKAVNDAHGHAAGDSMLLQVAARLIKAVRSGDLVARVGGDEFVILCSKISIDAAKALAERVRQDLAVSFNLGEQAFFAGGSVGVAHTDTTETSKLLDAGDTAMYLDKRQRKSRAAAIKVPGSSNGQYDVTDEHAPQPLECELRCAIERDQLLLHYQPLISSSTGEVVGFEALLRWQHPERGMIPPLEFIPLAEKSGLIMKIGQWVLQTACAAAASWNEPYWVAVNVSPAQFHSHDLPQTVSDILARTGLPADRLEIEVTESLLMEAPKQAADLFSALRRFGVRIAMDDFGTGYSSLGYLHEFKFDKLKIDRSFVKRFGQTEDATFIVSAIIDLARKLGLTIVAEGVETVQQLNALRDLGCDQIQGYLIARPIQMDSPAELLAACARIYRESRERNLSEQRLGIADSETKAAAADVEQGHRPLKRPLNVLVVDDITMSRDIAQSFLRAAGHCVVCVEGGAEAVAAAADTDFNVVLMDVCMPEMDGLEATRRIRALEGGRGRVPIVAVTAQAFAGQVSECRKAGMNGHVSKPFEPEMLVAAVVRAAVTGPQSDSFGPGFALPMPATGMPPIVGADLSVLDPKVFDRTTSFLAPEAVAAYLTTIAVLGESLLRTLDVSNSLVSKRNWLAEAALTVSGGGGMFGFERLAAVGRQFQHALTSGTGDAPVLAESLSAALNATLPEIHSRKVAKDDARLEVR